MTPSPPPLGPWLRVGRDHVRLWSGGGMAAACRWQSRGRWLVTLWAPAGGRVAQEEHPGTGAAVRARADVLMHGRGWI